MWARFHGGGMVHAVGGWAEPWAGNAQARAPRPNALISRISALLLVQTTFNHGSQAGDIGRRQFPIARVGEDRLVVAVQQGSAGRRLLVSQSGRNGHFSGFGLGRCLDRNPPYFFVQRVGETIRRFARVDCHLAARDEASSGIGRADSLWTHRSREIERNRSFPCTLQAGRAIHVEAIVSGAIRTLAVTRSAPKVAGRTVRPCP